MRRVSDQSASDDLVIECSETPAMTTTRSARLDGLQHQSIESANQTSLRPLEDLTLLSARQVSEMLGVSESWTWAQLQQGAFPQPVRLGRRCTRWRLADIRAYVERRAMSGK